MTILRIAIRELWNQKKLTGLILLNLFIGLIGFTTLQVFEGAFNTAIALKSRTILSADIGVSARRALTDAEEKAAHDLVKPVATTHLTEMFSMAIHRDNSRLVQVRAVERGFPFYGEIKLDDNVTATHLPTIGETWVYPEVLLQLKAKVGDVLQIGESRLKITAVVTSDVGAFGGAMSFAPRIYIAREQIPATNLISQGTVATYSTLFRLADDSDTETLAQELDKILDDPGVRISTHKDASEQVGRLINYLNDFLSLIAIVALLLASVGVAYLFRTYLQQKIREMAILRTLGASAFEVIGVYYVQLVILTLVSLVPVWMISRLVLPIFEQTALDLMGTEVSAVLSTRILGLTAIVALANSTLLALPFLASAARVSPALLLQSENQYFTVMGSWRHFLPVILFYWVMAMITSHSWRTGSAFMASTLVSVTILYFLFRLLSRLLADRHMRSPVVNLALKMITRNPLSSFTSWLAISLGSLLIFLVPQLHLAIQRELAEPTSHQTPSLFLFDIQDDQREPLTLLLDQEKIVHSEVAPMIRGRLMTINDKPFEKSERESFTREEQREAQFRNRGFNLSFRKELSSSEKIIAGQPFSGLYQASAGKPAELSVEERFADRIGVKIGDILRFEIEGISVEGQVINLRKVVWTAFTPNFFVLFQPGLLEDAPKSYIVSLARLPQAEKMAIQTKIVNQFSNISIIDISQLVGKILDIVQQMSIALRAMATITLVSGITVLFSMIYYQVRRRQRELTLLKILGARPGQVLGIILVETAIITLGSLVLSSLLSFGFVSMLLRQIFNLTGTENFNAAAGATALGILGILFVALIVLAALTTGRVIRQTPSSLLAEP